MSDAARAQAEAQSAKSCPADWNRPKLFLLTLCKPASRLEALEYELKVPQTFAHFRMSRSIIKFWGDLSDQPGSVMV